MNFFEKIKYPNNNVEEPKKIKKENGDDIDQGRRDFLGLIGNAGVVVVGSTVLGMNLARVAENFLIPDKEKTNLEKKTEKSFFIKQEAEEDEEPEEGQTESQKEIFNEDFKSIADLVDFNKKGKIVFDKNTVGDIQHDWEGRYRNDSKLNNSFSKAYFEMGAWRKYLEAIFEHERVPIEFIYLAIPESHWNMRARSWVGAAGPYQFIRKTANDYGLVINQVVDERCDPIKSCQACAKLLKYLYNRTGDWRLALSGYNGGFIWQYLKEADREKKSPSYEDYLEYVEGQLNRIKTDYKVNKKTTHFVYAKNGERITNIAKKYGVDARILIRANNLGARRVVERGKTIVVPLPIDEIKRKKLYQRRVAGYVENLNYPGKFFAVQRLIENKVVDSEKKSLKFVERTVSSDANGEEVLIHKVASGEGLYAICRKYKVIPKKLLRDNPVLARYNKGLPIGLNLKIVKQAKKPLTLEFLAKRNPEVYQLNPAIINPKKPLLAGMNIRFNA